MVFLLLACIDVYRCIQTDTHTHTHTLTHSHTHTGLQHIPIGPLSPEQEQLAHAASDVSSQPKETENQPGAAGSDSHNPHLSERAMGMSGALNRPSGSQVKAFSGKGHTLSSSSNGGGSTGTAARSEGSTSMQQGRSEASGTGVSWKGMN